MRAIANGLARSHWDMTETASASAAPIYGATKREVQEKLRELQGESDNGTISDAGRLTIGEYLQPLA